MSDKYAVIAAHRDEYPITCMCAALAVSPSGFYAAQHRPPSARATADEALRLAVRAAHRKSRRTYGAPRVHHELRAQGTRVAKKRVAKKRVASEAGQRERPQPAAGAGGPIRRRR